MTDILKTQSKRNSSWTLQYSKFTLLTKTINNRSFTFKWILHV